MKKICVSVVGSGQLHEITIQPGTTAGDILRDLNLADYLLSKSPSAEFFAATESVYDKISDGEKVFASTKATVGTSFFDALLDLVRSVAPGNDAGSNKLAQTATATRPIALSTPARQRHLQPVRRSLLPYWQEAGWAKTGNVYQGTFQTRFGAFQGWIEERSPYDIKFYVLNPPPQVLNSQHGPCFQPRGNNWYDVHMAVRPRDVGSGICEIERLIGSCLRSGR